ncbi:MAG: hypothetical protein A2Y82_03775 [Candidatus Buchananbacteria bacterium RBG_13_36_9]|uniref:Uncharacterized protein n=1 Tax=Candidatus Buchananbacteria bacterium RBG_13_36_9 TaxID=1797530 RepID=A0A1G1XMT6_9BACT|nr:MAG: hypothetical protein A2Y82_03775 [Candidatus Buchananbacteria bacterium RBG_13_36_9]
MKRLPLISIFTLFIAGILLIIMPISWLPYFYDVRYLGWSMILGALTIYLLPAFIKVPANSPDAARKNRAAELLQYLLTIDIVANALGSLGLYELYQIGIPYSYILHVIVPLVSVLLLSIVITLRWQVRISRSTIIAFCLVIICGLLWEIFENYSDQTWGTHLKVLGLGNTTDTTAINLLQDTIGAIVGTVIVLMRPRFKKIYGSFFI